MMEFEIENCLRNIEFYKNQIQRMQEKIVVLRKNKEESASCSQEELVEKLKQFLITF